MKIRLLAIVAILVLSVTACSAFPLPQVDPLLQSALTPSASVELDLRLETDPHSPRYDSGRADCRQYFAVTATSGDSTLYSEYCLDRLVIRSETGRAVYVSVAPGELPVYVNSGNRYSEYIKGRHPYKLKPGVTLTITVAE